ncbi:MAG: hypothetical protein IJH44_00435 [Solobacterium sp.]|nr:hypothetical protein [Solobacterium sp.]
MITIVVLTLLLCIATSAINILILNRVKELVHDWDRFRKDVNIKLEANKKELIEHGNDIIVNRQRIENLTRNITDLNGAVSKLNGWPTHHVQ